MTFSVFQRNKLKFSIVIALFVVVLGYSLFWHYQANVMQKKFEDEIAKSNNDADLKTIVQYKSIEKSGYPFSIVISVINPKIDSVYTQEGSPLTIDLNGKIDTKSSIFRNIKSIFSSGKAYITVAEDPSKPPFKMIIDGDIALNAGSGHFLPMFHKAFNEKLENFKNFDFLLSSLRFSKVLPNNENEELFYISKAELQYDAKKKSQTIVLSGDCIANQVSFVNSYTKENFPYTDWYSLYVLFGDVMKKYTEGKVHYNFSFKTELPDVETLQKMSSSPKDIFLKVFPKFSCEVKNFDIVSPAGTFHHKGFFTLSENKKKEIQLDFASDADFTFTKETYEKDLLAIKDFKRQVEEMKSDSVVVSDAKEFLSQHFDDIDGLIPKLYQLGTISSKVKGSFNKGKRDLNFTAKISDLGFTSDLYGILFNIDVQKEDAKISYLMSIDLSNYKKLVHDTVKYINHALSVYNLFKDKDKQPLNQISHELEDKILDYLIHISDSPTKEQTNIKITFRGDGDVIKVGPLDFATFLDETNKLRDEIEKTVLPEPPKPQQQTDSK